MTAPGRSSYQPNFTLAEQGPSKDDYAGSLDGLPLSSWRYREELGP